MYIQGQQLGAMSDILLKIFLSTLLIFKLTFSKTKSCLFVLFAHCKIISASVTKCLPKWHQDYLYVISWPFEPHAKIKSDPIFIYKLYFQRELRVTPISLSPPTPLSQLTPTHEIGRRELINTGPSFREREGKTRLNMISQRSRWKFYNMQV